MIFSVEGPGEVEDALREEMRSLDHWVDGFHGIDVRRDGERASILFRWFADPNLYELSSAISGGPWSWWEAMGDVAEELETNFLMAAIKARDGAVLKAELDGQQIPGDLDPGHYLQPVRSSGLTLADDGLDVRAGRSALEAGALLDWSASYVNAPVGGSAVGQVVVVRRNGDQAEAEMTYLELSPHAAEIVGHRLVFAAIHDAARHGMHRLYAPTTMPSIEAFGFAAVSGEAELVVYDITAQDLNWPETLRTRVITRR